MMEKNDNLARRLSRYFTRVASSRPMLMFGRFTDDAIFLSDATDAIFFSDMAPDAATGLGAIECEQTHV